MSRRDARIAREAARKLRERDKSARLRDRPGGDEVRLGASVPAEKQARRGADPGSIYAMRVSWGCNAPDLEGTWSWGVRRCWAQEDWDTIMLPKLQEWAQLTWGEIDRQASGSGHKMHHNMDVEVICEEAQLRLIEIEQYEEVIFRFRLGARPRLWAFAPARISRSSGSIPRTGSTRSSRTESDFGGRVIPRPRDLPH